jgi:tRNA dimethylallyltransferase
LFIHGRAMKKQKVVAIVGPTGSGKTALAIKLAQKFNGEIISADSRAVYRGLDIGTAKPTKEEQAVIPHHLLDVLDAGERFTVAQFQKLANQAIADITSRGKVPFLVGGTGLYVDAVLENFQFPPEGDPELRFHLDLESDERLLEILQTVDPQTYQKIDRQNRRRVLRAVEVALSTGKSFSGQKNRKEPSFDLLVIGPQVSRQELYRCFDQRLENWLKQGFIEEVRKALDDASPDWMHSLGLQYRYFAQYIQGEIGLEEAMRLTKKSNYAFIKRQMTWFRRKKQIHWVRSQKEAESLLSDFLSK